jgi:DNA polymerase-3 subunit epsilon
VDTAVLGSVWLGRGNGTPGWLSLSELAGALGLPAERPHHALGDALTTAQVFLALATYLDGVRHETVGTLARAGGETGRRAR